MEASERTNDIILNFSQDEALVFFDWLARFNEQEQPAFFQDQAEQRVLWDLEAVLEKVLPELFLADYEVLLSKAREKIRDKE